MIRKLRMKLIGVSMLSIFVVFSLILGTIAFISYQKVTSDADDTLAILAANDGLFPKDKDPMPKPEDGPPEHGRQMSPELPYESRYFSVLFSQDGGLISVNTSKVAAVDTDEAITFGQEVFASGRTQGYSHSYRYTVVESDEGIRIIFLDCWRSLSNLRFFVGIGVLVFVLGMLAVLLLTILLSRYIVRPVAQSYEKQKRFITDAGHEIKTPLTIIDADAEVLAMDLGPNEWIADIQEQSKRLTELTNDLILLSRLEEDTAQAQMLDFPISDLAEEIARSFQALSITQQKEFSVSIQPMLTFCGDEKMIRQLFMILLDNALKYSPESGRISFSLEKTAKCLTVCVFNTTDFIERSQLSCLFDRFYRTDRSRNSQTGGHGLGLSIAAAIAAAHKGKIAASTEDEHSLLIRVTLPL